MEFKDCICCGESIYTKGNSLSRHPGLCVSCSSLLDGMGDSDELELAGWARKACRLKRMSNAGTGASGFAVSVEHRELTAA